MRRLASLLAVLGALALAACGGLEYRNDNGARGAESLRIGRPPCAAPQPSK